MSVRQLEDGSWERPVSFVPDQDWNLPQMLVRRQAAHPGQIAVERRTGVGSWRSITIDEVVRQVQETARGLVGLGLQAGERLAILAPTSYEWAIFDAATLSCGGVTVPIYETDSASQIHHILAEAEVVLVLTATSQQAELVESVRTPSVRRILALDRGAEREIAQAGRGVDPQEVTRRTEALGLDDDATIIFTSGTTGVPKGVVLTHENFIATLVGAYEILPALIDDPNSRSLLFLPVAHVLARFVMWALLSGQGRIAFSPDTRNLVGDIASFQPTMLLVVPRVLEKVYNAASAKAGSGFSKQVFSWAVKQARDMSAATAYVGDGVHPELTDETSSVPDTTSEASPGPGFGLRVRHRIAEALALSKVRSVLGPNLQTVICGGAPLALDL